MEMIEAQGAAPLPVGTPQQESSTLHDFLPT
jgi:hypothetical protein